MVVSMKFTYTLNLNFVILTQNFIYKSERLQLLPETDGQINRQTDRDGWVGDGEIDRYLTQVFSYVSMEVQKLLMCVGYINRHKCTVDIEVKVCFRNRKSMRDDNCRYLLLEEEKCREGEKSHCNQGLDVFYITGIIRKNRLLLNLI